VRSRGFGLQILAPAKVDSTGPARPSPGRPAAMPTGAVRAASRRLWPTC